MTVLSRAQAPTASPSWAWTIEELDGQRRGRRLGPSHEGRPYTCSKPTSPGQREVGTTRSRAHYLWTNGKPGRGIPSADDPPCQPGRRAAFIKRDHRSPRPPSAATRSAANIGGRVYMNMA
ncbi:hypothetical protein [Streptosporangium vulgare]|uniref:hypothetical protein n=1 Tax=Streptosporangium vulgare TaxID=46190 RepID=UPI0031DD903C